MSDHPLPTHMQDALEAVRNALSSFLSREVDLSAELSEPTDGATTGRRILVGRSGAGEAIFAVGLDEGWIPMLSESVQDQATDTESTDFLQDAAARLYSVFQEQATAAGLAPPDAAFTVAESVSELPTPVQTVTFEWERDEEILAGCILLPIAPSPPTLPGTTAESGVTLEISRASFEDLGSEHFISGDGGNGNLDILSDVELEVTVELGRRRLPLADVLRLTTGSIIELEKLVGQPLEIYANGRLIAEGEAVVIDEQFGVRVTNLAARNNPKRTSA